MPVGLYRARMVSAQVLSSACVVIPVCWVHAVSTVQSSCIMPTSIKYLPWGVAFTHVQVTGNRASANSIVLLSPLKYGVPVVRVTRFGSCELSLRFRPRVVAVGAVVCIVRRREVHGWSWVTWQDSLPSSAMCESVIL